jgi:peptidoglycan hydrolase-like protein with peptidoglycan-binding domain
MKKIILATGIAFALPVSALAQTTDVSQLQAQVQSLLSQVTQLQQSMGTGGSSTGAAVSCPDLSRSLKKGSTGDDVTRLQQFLAQDPTVYPEGTVSGYFGALTEAAVQRWQAKYNIVSSGTPDTTGYGVVGPRTAAAIALLCSQGGGATTQVGGYIQVSPISGNAPLTVNVQANVNTTNSCQAATYTLDWGDNTTVIQLPVSANVCTAVSQSYSHVYQNPGTYQIILASGTHRTTAQVAVYGSVR